MLFNLFEEDLLLFLVVVLAQAPRHYALLVHVYAGSPLAMRKMTGILGNCSPGSEMIPQSHGLCDVRQLEARVQV